MLSLTLLLTQNPLLRVVTFDEPAQPLARLLPALIVASETVARDVVLVRAKESPSRRSCC